MGMEIERKFLIVNDSWRPGAKGIPYAQGYLSRGRGNTVRIRIAGEEAFLTIKGPVVGISRPEFEYSIPLPEAREMLSLCNGPLIEKTRFKVFSEGHLWEIDEFHGENDGLIVAEIELTDPDEEVALPLWIGKEVTGESRYYNSNLTIHPYRTWLEETSSQAV
jgi:adenylate cyclase